MKRCLAWAALVAYLSRLVAFVWLQVWVGP